MHLARTFARLFSEPMSRVDNLDPANDPEDAKLGGHGGPSTIQLGRYSASQKIKTRCGRGNGMRIPTAVLLLPLISKFTGSLEITSHRYSSSLNGRVKCTTRTSESTSSTTCTFSLSSIEGDFSSRF